LWIGRARRAAPTLVCLHAAGRYAHPELQFQFVDDPFLKNSLYSPRTQSFSSGNRRFAPAGPTAAIPPSVDQTIPLPTPNSS
jgi:hypothetical protein